MSSNPTSQPTQDHKADCCAISTGFCVEHDDHTFSIPLLDLSLTSNKRPTVDGYIHAQEYASYLELPMFNGGKNGQHGSPLQQSNRIGTAYLAYDCNSDIVCVAAFLDEAYLAAKPWVQVEQLDDESWVRFGPNGGETKLKESNSDVFQYVRKWSDAGSIIGYEGCWNIDLEDPKMQSVANNYVEVHFTRSGGETTSSGKPASNGKYICLDPNCERTPCPTNHPSSKPTMKPNALPSKLPTVNPTASPTVSPSTMLTEPSLVSEKMLISLWSSLVYLANLCTDRNFLT